MTSWLIYTLGFLVGIATLVLAGILVGIYFLLRRNEEQKLGTVKIRTRSERRKR
jgi:hypothetical protein